MRKLPDDEEFLILPPDPEEAVDSGVEGGSEAAAPALPPARLETLWISDLRPCVEGGRFPAKRVEGDELVASADILKDGHGVLSAVLRVLPPGGPWDERWMVLGDNDRWSGSYPLAQAGRYRFTVEAWPDDFRSWKHAFKKKLEAEDPEMPLVCEEGARLVEAAAARAAAEGDGRTPQQLRKIAAAARELKPAETADLLLSVELQKLLDFWPDRSLATRHHRELELRVERRRAQFSAWYEFFPRSALNDGKRHATFRDCGPMLDHAAAMGFDVVYLPPVHPIGKINRKGKNNSPIAAQHDVGSPWAIGSAEGGHRDIEPALGTLEDFDDFLEEAAGRGLEVALDFALQCAPDHPYVAAHPDWFHIRPDGSIMHAENPPKKYEDIYPLNFHCADWENLWAELIDIVRFWCRRGVRIFRVDNPHTKPIAFWGRLIGEIQGEFPGTLFLAEAFTRPKMMAALAKVGFSQSYTYFTWRVSKDELTEYGEELTSGEAADCFRGNFWPNTPDILAYHLMGAPPAMFKIRAALAATMSSSWGIYSGYELCENEEFGNGKEEYRDSEKYQLVERDWDARGNITAFITRLNQIRKDNPALHGYANLRFHHAANDRVLCYSKSTGDGANRIVTVVSLDPVARQESTVTLPLGEWGISGSYVVEDLMHGDSYRWTGESNFVSLDPRGRLLHIFRVGPDEIGKGGSGKGGTGGAAGKGGKGGKGGAAGGAAGKGVSAGGKA